MLTADDHEKESGSDGATAEGRQSKEKFKLRDFSPLNVLTLIKAHGARQLIETFLGSSPPSIEQPAQIEFSPWQPITEVPQDVWEQQGKGHRNVLLGDVPVVESPINTVSDEEMKDCLDGMGILKSMVDTTDDPIEKAFLVRTHTSVLGLDSDIGLYGEEARAYYQALKRVGALDKFRVVSGGNKEDTSIVDFIHISSARRKLLANKEALNITDESLADDDETVNMVMRLSNNSDIRVGHKAQGLLAGFPLDAITDWLTDTDPRLLSDYRLKKLTPRMESYINHPAPIRFDSDRIKDSYTRSYELKKPVGVSEKSKEGGFNFLGLSFRTRLPPSEQVIGAGKKLLEVDRRTGLSDFMISVQSDVIPKIPIPEI